MPIKRSFALLATMVALTLMWGGAALAQGKPVAPGNATAGAFVPSTGCGCHAARVEEWRQSMHSKALSDPVFQVKVTQAEAAAGSAVGVFCRRCHSPIGNLLNDPTAASSAAAAEGVTCMFCHQVVGDTGAHNNTSQLIDANGVRRAQLKDPQAPHPTAFSQYLPTAEFCGGCHNVKHPANGTHLETSYSEWKGSPYAKAGVVCQDCHMSSEPGVVVGPSSGQACATGPTRNDIFAMSFVGANVGQGPSEASTRLLQSAATVELGAPEIAAAGSEASVSVTVTNKGAGHYLPTGLTEVRQMWLTVYAEGADGHPKQIGTKRFGSVLKDAKGDHPAEVWDAVGVYSDDRIPPKKSVTEHYSFTMPPGSQQMRLVAKLSYASLPDGLAAQAHVANPTTLMASADRTVYASAQAKSAGAAQTTSQPAPTQSPAGGPRLNMTAVVAGIAALLVAAGFGVYLWVTRRREE